MNEAGIGSTVDKGILNDATLSFLDLNSTGTVNDIYLGRVVRTNRSLG